MEKQNEAKSQQDIVLETAKSRADLTRRYIAEKNINPQELTNTLAGEPFKITIDQKDDTSLAKGIYALQKHLGFPDTESQFGRDGKFGPYTNKKLKEYLLHGKIVASLNEGKKDIKVPAKAEEVASAPAAPQARPQESNDKASVVPLSKTVFVGDSITYLMRNYTGPAKHVSKGAMQTGWMKTHLGEFLKSKEAKETQRVVILGGFNDITSTKSVKSVTDNLRAMYDMALKSGKSVAACTIMQWDFEDYVRATDKLWRKIGYGPYPLTAQELRHRAEQVNAWILAQKDVIHVDLYNETQDREKYKRGDTGIHAYGKYAGNLAHLIQEKGGIS